MIIGVAEIMIFYDFIIKRNKMSNQINILEDKYLLQSMFFKGNNFKTGYNHYALFLQCRNVFDAYLFIMSHSFQ